MANPKQIMMLMETDIFGIHAGTSRAVPGASQVEVAERNHSGNVYSQAKRSALPAPPRQVSHSVRHQQRSQAPYLPARQAAAWDREFVHEVRGQSQSAKCAGL
jgi:hypothetical protein